MSFDKFKNIIISMYDRETKPAPNYPIIKGAFDAIDLRKDGIIDMSEWLKAFSVTEVININLV